MFIEATKIIGLPVAAEDAQAKIGTVRQLIFDPQSGRLLGFFVGGGRLLSSQKILSITDIREWDPNGLITSSIENLVTKDEIIRIKEIIDQKIIILGMRAKTEAGKSLGKVEDLLVDTESECIAKFYLKDMFSSSRVLPIEKVIRIEKNTIIFANDDNEVPAGAAGALDSA